MPGDALDEIEEQIVRIISAVPERSAISTVKWPLSKRLFQTRREESLKEKWREEIISNAFDLGRRLGFRAEGTNRGWMFDVVWRDVNYEGWGTNSVPLVLGCDWHVSSFSSRPSTEMLDKLLVARADHRVLVCQHDILPDNMFDGLADYIDCGEITKAGERYLFFCYQREDQRFYSHLHIAR